MFDELFLNLDLFFDTMRVRFWEKTLRLNTFVQNGIKAQGNRACNDAIRSCENVYGKECL